jgi:hypothetical protein
MGDNAQALAVNCGVKSLAGCGIGNPAKPGNYCSPDKKSYQHCTFTANRAKATANSVVELNFEAQCN